MKGNSKKLVPIALIVILLTSAMGVIIAADIERYTYTDPKNITTCLHDNEINSTITFSISLNSPDNQTITNNTIPDFNFTVSGGCPTKITAITAKKYTHPPTNNQRPKVR
ncbi:hypothetical protein C5S39_01890 [Candidatus Methanophagaceae archaeon]|nr:hypothetical protein C5S39_01890 [Methanophagales archaeon]